MVLSEHGHAVNKWCGSCQFKEVADEHRLCKKHNIYVEIDGICNDWELEEKLSKI